MMTVKEKEDVKILLDYAWDGEKKHYQCAPCKNHIFTVLKRLAKGIGYKVIK